MLGKWDGRGVSLCCTKESERFVSRQFSSKYCNTQTSRDVEEVQGIENTMLCIEINLNAWLAKYMTRSRTPAMPPRIRKHRNV